MEYAAYHAQADAVHAAVSPIDAIRDESARREGGMCGAVFRAAALSITQPHAQQIWICKASARAVLFTSKGHGGSPTFDFTG